VRRRAERERAELMRFGGEPLSRSLLPVLDNLRRALEAGGQAAQRPTTVMRTAGRGSLRGRCSAASSRSTSRSTISMAS
jgi:hypothetical protein